jgi:hypothetical protein
MAFTFRIVFSGLIAFVPDKPFDGTEPVKSIHVLLPNALKPRLLKPSKPSDDGSVQEPLILPPHYPLLVFDTKTLQPVRDPQFFFVKENSDSGFFSGSATQRGMAPLLSSDITILPDGREPDHGGLRLINGRPKDESNPTEEELQSLSWLKKIDKLGGGIRNVDPRFLESLSKDEKVIVARLLLTTGRLRTFEVSGPKWQYLELGAPIKDPEAGDRVATKLALEFEADHMVKVVFRSFGSTTPSKLIFAPPAQEPFEDVRIDIQNLEPEKILEMDQDEDEDLHPAPEIDPDFSIFYDLLEGFGETDPRPVPRRSVPAGAGRSAGDGKPCSPVAVKQG